MTRPLVIVLTGEVAAEARQMKLATEYHINEKVSWNAIVATLMKRTWDAMSRTEKEKAGKLERLRQRGIRNS